MHVRSGGGRILLLASIAWLAPACHGKERDGAESARAGRPKRARSRPPSARAGLRPLRPLLGEVARAELRAPGLFFDLGTPEASKYTRGGWGTGWGDRREQEGTRYATVEGARATLFARLLRAPAEVLVRARTKEGTGKLELWIDGERRGSFAVGPDWSVARVPVSGVKAGRRVLELRRRGRGGPLYVDWLSVAPEAGGPPPAPSPRVGPIRVGGRVRRALLAPTSRSYSFYLQVPAGARLIFDAGSGGRVRFAVRAETVDGDVLELFEGRARAGRWSEHVVDLSTLAGRAVRLELSTDGAARSTGWGEPTLYVPRHERRRRRRARPAKNLILVVLDTTRADSFAPFDPDNEVQTPAFDAFAARSTAFVNAYNNENWTKPSTATLLSGLYPSTHTARWAKSVVPEEVTFLSQHLDRHGFTTGGLVSNAVLSARFGFDRGWDQFENFADGDQGNGYYLYRRAAKWLDRHAGGGRFFLYIQSIDPHTTYAVPRRFSRPYFPGRYRGVLGQSFSREEQSKVDRHELALSDRDLAWVRALYHGEVSYQDRQLGVLFDEIEKLGLWDDTIVVVTNDHGEELADHRHMGHGWTLYDELLRAPLTIYDPPMFPAGLRVEEVVEQVDLAPTLVEALGVAPLQDVDGLSLLPLVSGRPGRRRPSYAVSASRDARRSIRVGRWKLIVGEKEGWVQLFDLRDDPREQRDRREDATLAARLCEIYLGEALASPAKAGRASGLGRARRLQAQDAVLDPRTRRQLEALGYL